MKHLLSIALLLAATAVPAVAQTAIGYTNETVARKEGHRFGSGTTQGLVIYLPPEKAAILKGSRIVGLRSAFGTSQMTDLTAFVTTTLDPAGAPLTTQALTGASTKMQAFSFDNPVEIDGRGLYVGYTFTIGTTYLPLLFDQSADTDPGLAWAWSDSTWIDVSGMGYGAANIQILVDGAPSFTDLMVKPVACGGYLRASDSIAFSGQLFNFGTEAVTAFDLIATVGDGEPQTVAVRDVSIAPRATYDFTLDKLYIGEAGRVPFSVTVGNINGADADADAGDNATAGDTYVYPSDMEKRILVEMFTGQYCSNCPAGHRNLAAALAGAEEECVEVAHHAGYSADFFTMTEDVAYLWLFNSATTFAPGVAFNRTPATAEATSAVVAATDLADLEDGLAAVRDLPPYVSVAIAGTFDEITRRGTATVTLHTYDLPADDLTHTLTLCLVQDGITAYQTLGGNDYVHDHVFRGSLNSTWGETVTLTVGETVTRSYDYEIPDSILSTYQGTMRIEAIPADMTLVAYVGAWDAAAPTACRVYNAAACPVAGGSQSSLRSQVSPKSPVVCRVAYDLTGRRVAYDGSEDAAALAAVRPGIYLVRTTRADGTTETRRVIVR